MITNNAADVNEEERKKFIKALDAILAVDHEQHKEFRQAVIDNKELWNKIHASFVPEKPTIFGRAIGSVAPVDSEEFLNPDEPGLSFLQIQQAAAAQRVKFGLDKVTQQEVLLHILQNNEEECRAYLAEKVAPEVAEKAKGWIQSEKPAPVDGKEKPAINRSVNVLPDDIIKNIKKQAAARWILLAIEEAQLDVLNKIDAANGGNRDAFVAAIKELGFPNDVNSIAALDMDLIYDLITEKLREKRNHLMHEAAITDYDAYIAALDDDALFAQGELLKKEGEAFRADLDDLGKEGYKETLQAPELAAIREKLGVRYLHVALARSEENLLPLFKATPDKFKEELSKLFPEHTYIDQLTFTKEQIKSLKSSAAEHLMSHVHDYINSLASGSQTTQELLLKIHNDNSEGAHLELADLRQSLTDSITASIPSDDADPLKAQYQDLLAIVEHIKRKDILPIQETARLSRLEYQIKHHNYFAPNRHSVLVEVFKTLTVKQKVGFLNASNASLKTPALGVVMNATDINVLKHYFPDVNQVSLEKLLKENKENLLLKSIQNPVIADILLSLEPRVVIEQLGINVINSQIQNLGTAVNDAEYTLLIKNIQGSVATPMSEEDKANFYKAFAGKDVNGNSVQDDVKRQQDANEFLFDALKIGGNVNADLLKFLISVKKFGDNSKNELNISNQAQVQAVEKAFALCTSAQAFIDGFVTGNPLTDEKKQFKALLERELTPTVFRTIKNSLRVAVFTKSPQEMSPELDKVEQILKDMKNEIANFEKQSHKLDFILNVNEMHIHSALFKQKTSERRFAFAELLNNCNLILEQLRFDQRMLNDYKKTIPVPPPAVGVGKNAQEKVIKRVEKLHADVQARLDEINPQLAKYKKIKSKLDDEKHGILVNINSIHSKKYVLANSSVVTGLMDRQSLTTEVIKSNVAHGGQGAILELNKGDAGDIPLDLAKFSLEEDATKDKVRYFDITHTTDSDEKVDGRFIYAKRTSEEPTVVADNKGLSKSSPGYYEVLKFPQKAPNVTDDELKDARIKFAMTLALQALSNHESKPTAENPARLWRGNKDELSYIWTALVVCGVKTDAVEIMQKDRYDPSEQMGMLGRFKGDSLYRTFKDHPAVQQYLSALKQQTEARFDKKTMKVIDTGSKNATEFFKKDLQNTKDAVNRRVETDGPTPEEPGINVGPK